MKKGTTVSMDIRDTWETLNGVTIEDECSSPTLKNPDRRVIRVRWEDGTESIENVQDLY